uniref:Uncharacterized protein n=1 Tax=Avena sativa TaxID=4498 RepID=A0ACD6AG00_AVESA
MANKKIAGQVGAPSTDIMTSYRSSYQGFNGQTLQQTHNLRALIAFQLPPISLHKLRFLRVLHIEDSRLKNFSREIGGCIHLRCLRLVSCKDVTLPSSIGKHLYLQTIDMTNTYSLVPKSMWDIPSLRHVYLTDEFSPPNGVQLNELQTFKLRLNCATTCSKYCNPDMVRFLGQMTQLTTLWLATFQCMPARVMDIFANMPCLVDIRLLTNLGVFSELPDVHHFPQSLRSFDLSAVEIRQDPMPVLEKLQCLVVLTLKGYSGQTMSCSANGFPRLQNIKLYRFSYIEEWRIESGAMPKLSHVTLSWFPKMSKLAEGLLHLPSLSRLKLQNMRGFGYDNTLEELQQKGCEVTKTDGCDE